MRLSKITLVALAALTLALAAIFAIKQRARYAPAVVFTLINGEKIPIKALHGHPALITFWSLSCAPCLHEIPALTTLYQQLHPHGLQLIAVALADNPPAYVLSFSQQQHLPYRISLDMDGVIAQRFGVEAIPRAFLLDAQGHIRHDWTGAIDFVKLRYMLGHLTNTP